MVYCEANDNTHREIFPLEIQQPYSGTQRKLPFAEYFKMASPSQFVPPAKTNIKLYNMTICPRKG